MIHQKGIIGWKGMFRRRQHINAFDAVNVFFLLLLAFVCFYPFWQILIASFNNGSDYMQGGVYWWPRVFSLDNYTLAFSDERLVTGFTVSTARVVVGTVTSLIFTSIVAYGMALKDIKGKKITFAINIVTMFFSGGLVPYFLLLKQIRLLNTFWVYIIPSIYSVFNMIIISNFFRELPDSLRESALIDGAGEFRVYLSLYLPLSKPVLATVALWIAVGHWNAYFDSMLLTTDPKLMTLQLFLMKLIKEAAFFQNEASLLALDGAANKVAYQTMRFATIVIATVPILCVYPFLQKYFTKGILLGSIKG